MLLITKHYFDDEDDDDDYNVIRVVKTAARQSQWIVHDT
jgi:hypothetical protein